jgi:class I fructose-bisphosphate aldolase
LPPLPSSGRNNQTDIIKQKLPETNSGNMAISEKKGSFGKFHEKMYTELTTDHQVDLVRYQVAHNYMGRIG